MCAEIQDSCQSVQGSKAPGYVGKVISCVKQGMYRILKVVFHEFPGSFHVHFPGLSMSIFHVFPVRFNGMDTELVRLSYK